MDDGTTTIRISDDLPRMRRDLAALPAITEEQARTMVAGLKHRLREAEARDRLRRRPVRAGNSGWGKTTAFLADVLGPVSPLYDLPARRDLPQPVVTLALMGH